MADEGVEEKSDEYYGGNYHVHERIDHHSERLVRLEAHREHDREKLQALEQGSIDANQRIEDRFQALQDKISGIGKTVNRNYWLLLGGFSVLITLGGLSLWVLEVVNRLGGIVGSSAG